MCCRLHIHCFVQTPYESVAWRNRTISQHSSSSFTNHSQTKSSNCAYQRIQPLTFVRMVHVYIHGGVQVGGITLMNDPPADGRSPSVQSTKGLTTCVTALHTKIRTVLLVSYCPSWFPSCFALTTPPACHRALRRRLQSALQVAPRRLHDGMSPREISSHFPISPPRRLITTLGFIDVTVGAFWLRLGRNCELAARRSDS